MSFEPSLVGKVVSLWRYPVKSMLGEELNASDVGGDGLVGDRAYAIVDRETGKVASAKNPKKWPTLFQFRAAYVDVPKLGSPLPPVRITVPSGEHIRSDDLNIHRALSNALGREVALQTSRGAGGALEEYWPKVEGLSHQDHVTDEAIREGTFFDAATVHLMTTATLDRLRQLYPEGRFEVRRFRPNIIVASKDVGSVFPENDWEHDSVLLGDRVRLYVDGPCARCVMTTLPQADLPFDLGILRTAVKHNHAAVGVYTSVTSQGTIRQGDQVMRSRLGLHSVKAA